jgi:hypothetical protein
MAAMVAIGYAQKEAGNGVLEPPFLDLEVMQLENVSNCQTRRPHAQGNIAHC